MMRTQPGASAHSALISPKPLTPMPHPRFSHMLSSAAALDAVETTALPSARRIASSTVTAAMSATQDRPVATQSVGDPSTPRVAEVAANGTTAIMTTSVSDPELSRMVSASPSTALSLSCESPDQLIGGNERVRVAVAVTEAVPVSTSATDQQPRKQARRSRVAASIPATTESSAAATDAISLEKITKAAVRLVTEEFESEMASLQDELTAARLQVMILWHVQVLAIDRWFGFSQAMSAPRVLVLF
jgi:hypothetical protein